MYVLAGNRPATPGDPVADVFAELGLYTVEGRRGSEGICGGAVTDDGAW